MYEVERMEGGGGWCGVWSSRVVGLGGGRRC